jgi:hypothetical protein
MAGVSTMATQISHEIPEAIWKEFGPQLQSQLGFTEQDLIQAAENLVSLPTAGVEGGPSAHFNFDEAHSTYSQDVREYVDNVLEQYQESRTPATRLAQRFT